MTTAPHPAARYPLHVQWSDQDEAFLGSIPGLLGDCCHGDTPEAVLAQLKDIAEDVTEHLLAQGQDLPEPQTAPTDPDPALTRKAMGLSQSEFARLLNVSVRTLHKWEQNVSRPSGAARTLLRLAAADPQSVKRVLVAAT